MSTVLVRYRIARTGQPVPSGSPPPPDYVPWPHASITWRRIESDYGPGIVRPRDSLTTRADEHGEGAVYLAPGRYRITLPSRDTRDVTVSAEPAEIDLSALLAGGGVEPDDPQYPTLAAYVVDQIGVALEDQLDAIDEAVETAGEHATQTGLDAAATAADRLAVAQDRQAIESEQAARLAAIQTAGDTQVGRVEGEGDTQVQRVIDAGDALDVPLPVDQPDGRVLVTRGGGLAYSPGLSKLAAVENIDRIVAWDDFSGSGSLDGRVTPSGHTWTVSPTDLGGRGWRGSGTVDNGAVRDTFGAYITFAEPRRYYEVGARHVPSIGGCGIALGVPGAAVGIIFSRSNVEVRQVHGDTATELARFGNPYSDFDTDGPTRHLVVQYVSGFLNIFLDGVLVGERVLVWAAAAHTAAGIGSYDPIFGASSFYVRDLRGRI